ncbi:unnamed protein product [Didymodactylos carnosus]|uniref:Uncharacterized protein n=1 Tax=Didymodactylos carnosus TaxID=1234261 RepID=A0A8S2Z388_9BILA|nr:unnamed protein product [Didymodactylos carnosus]
MFFTLTIYRHRKSIGYFGNDTFQRIHDYLYRQRLAQKTDPRSVHDMKISIDLREIINDDTDKWQIVDQLVFYEINN